MNTNKNPPSKKLHHSPPEKKWWDNHAVNMAIHVLSTTFVFLVIATAAYALDCYVHLLEERKASEFLVDVLKLFEKAILLIDVAWALFNILHGIHKEYIEK